MAITRIDYVNSAIILLCVATAACFCEAKPFKPKRNTNPMVGLGHGNNLGTFSKAHPDERVFNVLEFGAKPGGKKDNQLAIKLNNVSNAIIRGITSLNPQGFHMFITNSQHIRAYNLHLLAPADSPNTDGIHISKSSFIKIARSVIATGDDCVSIGQSSTNISVKKVLCGPGHGLSIGSLGKYEDEGDVKGIIIKNCTLISTDNGLRIKTYGGSQPSQASNIIFQDIIMKGVKNPIIIDQEYQSHNKGPSRVKLDDIRYINVRGTSTSKLAVSLTCSKTCPCTNVRFNNINLKFVGDNQPKVPFSSCCTNAKVNYMGFQSPNPCR
ncbi:hypothetical protein ACFE04_012970 [Oxalis oulophora]